jgi:hypothetical protein
MENETSLLRNNSSENSRIPIFCGNSDQISEDTFSTMEDLLPQMQATNQLTNKSRYRAFLDISCCYLCDQRTSSTTAQIFIAVKNNVLNFRITSMCNQNLKEYTACTLHAGLSVSVCLHALSVKFDLKVSAAENGNSIFNFNSVNNIFNSVPLEDASSRALAEDPKQIMWKINQ